MNITLMSVLAFLGNFGVTEILLLLIFPVAFFALRMFLLWALRINEIIKNQEKQMTLLQETIKALNDKVAAKE